MKRKRLHANVQSARGQSSAGIIRSTSVGMRVLVEVRTPSGSSPAYALTVDGSEVPFVQLGRHWFEIRDSSRGTSGRVRYQGGVVTDRISISRPEGSIVIAFRLRRTVFELNGRQYKVRTILGGHIRILDGSTLAVKGKIILHGVRLEYVSEALRPFACELAMGFALKVAAMQPYPSLPFP